MSLAASVFVNPPVDRGEAAGVQVVPSTRTFFQ